jgi:hypothetical protein
MIGQDSLLDTPQFAAGWIHYKMIFQMKIIKYNNWAKTGMTIPKADYGIDFPNH